MQTLSRMFALVLPADICLSVTSTTLSFVNENIIFPGNVHWTNSTAHHNVAVPVASPPLNDQGRFICRN